MQWILDFDDTLVMGPNTWAFQEVLPDLIRTHGLPYDAALFESVMLKAQQQANEDMGEEEILDFVFSTLQWPDALKSELVHRVYNGYQPYLFDDVLPFLDHVHGLGHRIFMISNNNHAPQMTDAFGLSSYFTAILTPKHNRAGAVLRAKPQRDLWDALLAEIPLDAATTVMVGDDPWSDGTFSQRAGIACWIVDRLGRYNALHSDFPYQWAATLADIQQAHT